MSKHTWFFGSMRSTISFFLFVFLLINLLFRADVSPARAEGSKELVASGTGKRALTEWRVDTTAGLYRRTFFRVYAKAGENILMGSSAMGLSLGDIVLYQEAQVSNSQIAPAALSAITPTFRCSVDGGGLGILRGASSAATRSMEIQGASTNGGADGGYIPCVYTVPAGGTGIYWVAMYGPLGASPAVNINGSSGTIAAPVIDATQNSGVSVWDITVRAGSPLTGTNKPGRVFVDYLAQITAGNGVSNQVYSTVYAATTDGYVYQVDLNGLDPYGYILYGNRVGFLDPDGQTPLYHDVVTTNNQLTNPSAGVILPPASAMIFFNNPLTSDLPASILPAPIAPSITNISYLGSAGGETGYRNIGGQFTYTGNVGGISEIVISRDGLDFLPDNPLNRVIRSQAVVGTNIINWDGKDNTGAFFPVGNGYKYHVTFHAGEYHFPLIDAENSPNGGPSLTLLNPLGGVCPFNPNCHTGFYDDRGYMVSTGAIVGTLGVTLPGPPNGINPPAINHSDFVNGYDTTTAQRAWGNGIGNGFGNYKGLDLWAYIPVGPIVGQLNVIDQVAQDLRIVKSHSGEFKIGSNGGSFNITVSNVGTTAISGLITVTDTLPAGLTPVAATTPGGSGWNACTIAGQLVTCVHPNGTGLAVGASLQPITLTVDVGPSAAPGVTNTALVSNPNDTNPSNDQYSDPVTVINPLIQIVKTPASQTVVSGSNVNFTLTVTNPGDVALTSVVVTDALCNVGPTYVSGDTNTNNTLETTETWIYSCTVNNVTANFTNQADVSGTSGTFLVQDTDTATVNVVSTGMDKIISGTSETFTTGSNVAIGEIVTYQITMNLSIGLALNNVVITDRMDKGLAFVDCVSINLAGTDITSTVCPPTVSAITDPGDPATNPANPGRQVQFNIGNISAPSTASTLVIRYRAIVLDVIENQETDALNNSAIMTWTGGSLTASAPNVTIVEPDLAIDKSASPTAVTAGTSIQFTLVISHTALSSTDAFDVVVTDVLPDGLEYIACTPISYSGFVPTIQPDPCNIPGGDTLTFGWDIFPLNQSATIVFFARFDGTKLSLINNALVSWTSLPVDFGPGGNPIEGSIYNDTSTERWYDPNDLVNTYQATDGAGINLPVSEPEEEVDLPSGLPATGFAPNVITTLPEQPAEKAYAATDVWLEIPRLGVNIPIVGVPLVEDDWDVSWLWRQAGWLNGTAFPGWQGNSALTGHVTLPNGKSGPFVGLGKLKWGDQILVHAYGSVYRYEVRQNRTISPNNTSVLKHEEEAWLTLITCKTYIDATDTYARRIAVRAILVSVEIEKQPSTPRGGRQ